MARSILFFIIFNYGLFVFGIVDHFQREAASSGLNTYFYSILLFFNTLAGVGFFLQSKDYPQNYKFKFDIWFVGLVLLSFFIFFQQIEFNSVWLDEHSQFHSSPGQDLTQKASTEAQPPLSYILYMFCLNVFGVSEMGIRIYSTMATSLTVGFLYLTLKGVGNSKSLAALISVAYLLIPVAARFSVEGRPIAFGTLYEVFFIIFFMNFLSSKSWSSWLGLVGSGSVYLLSLGLQPVIVVFSLTAVSSLYFLALKEFKIALKAALGGLISFLSYLPFLFESLKHIGKDQEKKIDFSAFVSLLNNFNFQDVRNMIHLLRDFAPFMLAPVFIGVAYLLVRLVRRKAVEPALFIFMSATLLYPFIFVFFFRLKINWHIMDRYMISYIPLVFISFGAALYLLASKFKLDRRPRLLFCSLVLYFAHPLYAHALEYKSFFRTEMSNWRMLYQHLQNQEKGMAFLFHLNCVEWYPNYFIAPQFYDSSNIQIIGKDGHLPAYYEDPARSFIEARLESAAFAEKIYLIQTRYNWKTDCERPVDLKLLEELEFARVETLREKEWEQFDIVHLDVRVNIQDTLYSVMRRLYENADIVGNEYRFLHYFGLYELKVNKDKQKAFSYLEKLKSLEYSEELAHLIENFESEFAKDGSGN